MESVAGVDAYDSLSSHLKFLHDRLTVIAPDVDRVACALSLIHNSEPTRPY